MKEYYEQLLKQQETQYELMSAGAIVKATELVHAATRIADKNELTLEQVCDMTDKLDTVLASVAKLKKDMDYTQQQIAELTEEISNDNHE